MYLNTRYLSIYYILEKCKASNSGIEDMDTTSQGDGGGGGGGGGSSNRGDLDEAEAKKSRIDSPDCEKMDT